MANYSILQYANLYVYSVLSTPYPVHPLPAVCPVPHLAAEGLETLETGVVVKVISFRGEVIDTP